MLDARAVGLCQRAVMLAQFPERVVLAGVGAVALPAFSDHARKLVSTGAVADEESLDGFDVALACLLQPLAEFNGIVCRRS